MEPKLWTKEEDELISTWDGTYAELAEKLGRTVNGVRNRYRRLRDKGLVQSHEDAGKVTKQRPWTKEEDGELLAWEGTDQELADKLGRTRTSVSARRKRLKDSMPKALKAVHVSKAAPVVAEPSKANTNPKSAKNDFKDYPFWHNWPAELHITNEPVWNMTDLAEHVKGRASHGDLVYDHAPHVREHAIKMLQMMSNDEQVELVDALGIKARSKPRHDRMVALLGNEFLVEELYNYG